MTGVACTSGQVIILMIFSKLDYCQYLLSSQINYTITNLADHLKEISQKTHSRVSKTHSLFSMPNPQCPIPNAQSP